MAEELRLTHHRERLTLLKQQLAEREAQFPGDKHTALLEQIAATERLIVKYSTERKPKLYCVQGTVTIHSTDGAGVSFTKHKQIPTFFLDADVQGIVDKQHAEEIARDILDPYELQYESREFSLSVEPV